MRSLALALGIGATFATASTASIRVEAAARSTEACANAALPEAILDGPPAAAASDMPLGTLAFRTSRALLHLAVAAEPHARELGLMCVRRLAKRAGMIFVFPRDTEWEFWMKNTLVPLDMIWVADDGRVTAIAKNVPASTLATPDERVARRRGQGRYVIELAGGEAARDGIASGERLALPPLHADD